jgi:hypothetical protein
MWVERVFPQPFRCAVTPAKESFKIRLKSTRDNSKNHVEAGLAPLPQQLRFCPLCPLRPLEQFSGTLIVRIIRRLGEAVDGGGVIAGVERSYSPIN